LQLALLIEHEILDPNWFTNAQAELTKLSAKSETEKMYLLIAMVYRTSIQTAHNKHTNVSMLGHPIHQGKVRVKVVWMFSTIVFGWAGTTRSDDLVEKVVKTLYDHFTNRATSDKPALKNLREAIKKQVTSFIPHILIPLYPYTLIPL